MINPIYLVDFYKVLHYEQYPKGTQTVFSNFTPRNLMPPYNYAVLFGLRYFIQKYLDINLFRSIDIDEYKFIIEKTLGIKRSFEHIHNLKKFVISNGKLPIIIKSLPELSKVNAKCPMLFFYNIHPDFYWFTNYIETIMSCILWKGCMSATIASHFRDVVEKWANKTCDNNNFIDYQCHDFSFRGMSCLETACLSGSAHLNYFKGTDTLPAIIFSNYFYNKELDCGTSIPATEHSVMCSYGKEHEFDTYKNLITNIYPAGFVSIVSDTWDFWNVISDYLPKLKDEILSRNGKVVIRPDSGDPYKIICGDADATNELEKKGLIECLYDIFGGTINSKGFKELDQHIGAIYGDSITLEKCEKILSELHDKGFASNNIVFGIGSYSYQYNTRDTLGFAIKSTAIENDNNEIIPIYKNPKTDIGIKKSHKGLITVSKNENGEYYPVEHSTWGDYHSVDDELKVIY